MGFGLMTAASKPLKGFWHIFNSRSSKEVRELFSLLTSSARSLLYVVISQRSNNITFKLWDYKICNEININLQLNHLMT